MLVFNYRFFLLNVLIRSILMLGIKVRTVLNSELNGFHENVQHFNPRCNRSQNMTVNKAGTVLRDTLYIKTQSTIDEFHKKIRDAFNKRVQPCQIRMSIVYFLFRIAL